MVQIIKTNKDKKKKKFKNVFCQTLYFSVVASNPSADALSY